MNQWRHALILRGKALRKHGFRQHCLENNRSNDMIPLR